MRSFFDLNFDELSRQLEEWGEPHYRAHQIWQAFYHELVTYPEDCTSLPYALRRKLTGEWAFTDLTPAAEARSADGQSHKISFTLADNCRIEAVLMRYARRRSVCISAQAGCALACPFCATGQAGFQRNLSAGEIVGQVLWFARHLRRQDDRLTNIVVMGMGEPFLNYEATLSALDTLTHPDSFNFGARRITLSTAGVVPGIERFAREKRQVNLAISLHAATDDLRSELVPLNRQYPLADLFGAIRGYFATTRRRITFEWVLLHGKNDSPAQARALANLARDLVCHVNLIPLNPTPAYSLPPYNQERAHIFKSALENHGLACTLRLRRGADINAGCGQLATRPAS